MDNQRRLPHMGRSKNGGTGKALSGRSESRAEKLLERALEETGAGGGCAEKEGALRLSRIAAILVQEPKAWQQKHRWEHA